MAKCLNNEDAKEPPHFAEAKILLQNIRKHLRTRVSLEACSSPKETSSSSRFCKDDPKQQPVIHVDLFLYEDNDVCHLLDPGKLYCSGTNFSKPITFETHSMSVNTLQYIFCHLLPKLDGKIVLDIGSRLGAVLYGAHVYSSAKKIIGIETSSDLVQIQEEMIAKFDLRSRVQVYQGHICLHEEVVKEADVIILSKVFDVLVDPEPQVKVVQFLKETLKSGTLIVTLPSLGKILTSLKVDFEGWLTVIEPKVNYSVPENYFWEETPSDAMMYRVD